MSLRSGKHYRNRRAAALLASICLSPAPSVACEPLLLLIEGGGWSSSSRGRSIQALAEELESGQYRNANVTIALTDHTAFMGGLNYRPDGPFLDGPAPEAADCYMGLDTLPDCSRRSQSRRSDRL